MSLLDRRPGLAARRICRGEVRPAVHVLVFLLLTMGVYLATADYDREQNTDVVAVAVPVWSLVERGTVDVRPFEDLSPWFFEVDGRMVSNRWPGTMLVALPVYVLASPWVSSNQPALWPATVAAAVVAALAATTLFALVLAEHGRGAAWVAGILIAFGTGLWTVAADSLWTHGPGVLMIALALHALRANRQWLAGWCFGILGFIRLHVLVAAAMTGYVLARERRDPRVLVRLGVPAALGLVGYLLYAGALTGQGAVGILPYLYLPPTGWQRLENVVGVLIAPRVGLLIYTPVLICCVVAIGRAWRTAADWERAAFVGGLLYLVVQSQSNLFPGGFSFYGYRLPLEGLALMAPLLVRGGVAFARGSRARAVVTAALIAYSVWVASVGAVFHHGSRDVLDPPWTSIGPAIALAGRPVPLIVAVVVSGVVAVAGTGLLVRRAQGRRAPT